MTIPIAWLADDPCPGCGTGLVLLDDGGPRLTVECRPCGISIIWAATQMIVVPTIWVGVASD
jgi:hypothetical protein